MQYMQISHDQKIVLKLSNMILEGQKKLRIEIAIFPAVKSCLKYNRSNSSQ